MPKDSRKIPQLPLIFEYLKNASLYPHHLSTDRFLLMKNGSGISEKRLSFLLHNAQSGFLTDTGFRVLTIGTTWFYYPSVVSYYESTHLGKRNVWLSSPNNYQCSYCFIQEHKKLSEFLDFQNTVNILILIFWSMFFRFYSFISLKHTGWGPNVPGPELGTRCSRIQSTKKFLSPGSFILTRRR